MKYIGVIVNAVAIIVFGIIGTLLGSKLDKKYSKIALEATSLSAMIIGISGALKSQNLIVLLLSMVIGGVIGEALQIDARLSSLGDLVGEKFFKKNGNKGDIVKAFVSSSLLFAVGAMAITGSLESGLNGNHEILYAKSVMDAISAIILASTMGIGVTFSSLTVLIYEGIIVFGAGLLSGVLSPEIMQEMTAVGSVMIMVIGMNILKITDVKVANLVPAVFFPILLNNLF